MNASGKNEAILTGDSPPSLSLSLSLNFLFFLFRFLFFSSVSVARWSLLFFRVSEKERNTIWNGSILSEFKDIYIYNKLSRVSLFF